MFKTLTAVSAAIVGLVAAAPVSAAVLYTQNFDTYTGTASGSQPVTGLPVFTNGSVAGITGNGTPNMLQAVERAPGNYAAMLYDTNVISTEYYAGNQLGVTYTVSYVSAPTDDGDASKATQAGDIIRFILQDSSNTNYFFSDDAQVAFPNGNNTNTFYTTTFTYVGNGVGDVRLLVQNPNSNGRFAAAVDDIVVTDNVEVPEPMSIALLGAGLIGASMVRRRKAVA